MQTNKNKTTENKTTKTDIYKLFHIQNFESYSKFEQNKTTVIIYHVGISFDLLGASKQAARVELWRVLPVGSRYVYRVVLKLLHTLSRKLSTSIYKKNVCLTNKMLLRSENYNHIKFPLFSTARAQRHQKNKQTNKLGWGQ